MGCGRVDLIELYDLARDNMGGVRRRELEAHLQGCSLCTKDFHKLSLLVSAMKTIAADTDIIPSPNLLERIEAAMQKEASEFQSEKARELWTPQEKPTSRSQTRVTPPFTRWVKMVMKILLGLVVVAIVVAAAFRNDIKKELIWKGVELLPHYPLIGRVLGIPDRAGINRIIEAFPATDATAAVRLSDASRWLILAGAPVEETRFLELASRCAARSRAFPVRQPPDAELLDAVKRIWKQAEAAPFEQALAIYSTGNEMLDATLEGRLAPAPYKDEVGEVPVGTIIVHGSPAEEPEEDKGAGEP